MSLAIGNKTYRIGTRKSPLALKQAEEISGVISKFYPAVETKIVGIDTCGDKDKVTPISDIEDTDFFTKEIDKALLDGKIDFAVHSAKDLPEVLEEGLTIAAITDSVDPYDVLISKSGLKLDELPHGAHIGTSSLRRKEALRKFRSDFKILDIRGNVEERLKLLDIDGRQELDAIVIAAVGLARLGLENRITERIPFEILKPHPLQGALAIVARTGDSDLIKLLSRLDSGKRF